MTDTIRDLLISLSSHMAYMQGQLEAGRVLDDPEDYYWYRESVLLRQKVTDALADGPAVPDGREPVSVTGQPSDEDLWNTADLVFQANSWPKDAIRYARAVLARWGNPAPAPPADGEVVELVAWLREQLHVCLQAPWTPGIKHFGRAADLLQRLSTPQPPAEGEVAGLVRLLGSMAAEAELADQVHDASVLDRAADLLQRLSPPQPVPVSERPWEREGWCAEDGRCWVWNKGSCEWWELVDSKFISYSSEDYTHCLPAHALPVPGQEVR